MLPFVRCGTGAPCDDVAGFFGRAATSMLCAPAASRADDAADAPLRGAGFAPRRDVRDYANSASMWASRGIGVRIRQNLGGGGGRMVVAAQRTKANLGLLPTALEGGSIDAAYTEPLPRCVKSVADLPGTCAAYGPIPDTRRVDLTRALRRRVPKPSRRWTALPGGAASHPCRARKCRRSRRRRRSSNRPSPLPPSS